MGALGSLLADQFDVIRAVGDGGMALTAVTQLLPVAAVLDISMPILDGIEVAGGSETQVIRRPRSS